MELEKLFFCDFASDKRLDQKTVENLNSNFLRNSQK